MKNIEKLNAWILTILFEFDAVKRVDVIYERPQLETPNHNFKSNLEDCEAITTY